MKTFFLRSLAFAQFCLHSPGLKRRYHFPHASEVRSMNHYEPCAFCTTLITEIHRAWKIPPKQLSKIVDCWCRCVTFCRSGRLKASDCCLLNGSPGLANGWGMCASIVCTNPQYRREGRTAGVNQWPPWDDNSLHIGKERNQRIVSFPFIYDCKSWCLAYA